MVLFMANLVPSIIDSKFKSIIDSIDTHDIRLVLYFVPGLVFLVVLAIRRLFFITLGSRIGILIGSSLLSAACYFFWPIRRKEDDKIGFEWVT